MTKQHTTGTPASVTVAAGDLPAKFQTTASDSGPNGPGRKPTGGQKARKQTLSKPPSGGKSAPRSAPRAAGGKSDSAHREIAVRGRRRAIADNRRAALIAEAAYFRAESRGFSPGGELDDWLAAEREIDQT